MHRDITFAQEYLGVRQASWTTVTLLNYIEYWRFEDGGFPLEHFLSNYVRRHGCCDIL